MSDQRKKLYYPRHILALVKVYCLEKISILEAQLGGTIQKVVDVGHLLRRSLEPRMKDANYFAKWGRGLADLLDSTW